MSTDETGSRTPDADESELREMKVDELRERAKDEGVRATSSMRKEELVEAIGARQGGVDPGSAGAGEPGDAGPEGGRIRTGDETSRSLKYSQEVTSPQDEPERPGRSLATTSHEVIRSWAEERQAVPATVAGTEHEGRPGVLRLDFGDKSAELRHISWDEWLDTFDSRQLNFVYQEERKDGQQSNFFRLESPGREDA